MSILENSGKKWLNKVQHTSAYFFAVMSNMWLFRKKWTHLQSPKDKETARKQITILDTHYVPDIYKDFIYIF